MTFRRVLTVAALGWAAIGSAHAQTSDDNRAADALAADMRLLAANPLDIEALVTAGELTLKLGDPTAAAGFFTRAEKLDPNNPRVKAGWGSLLVRAERPGEALRRFQEAEARGLEPVRYAADRGLAYDLVGQQERAQRDYRLVLRNAPDDEVTRRYALSLAISGRKDEALKLLDPLLLRSDRAAWRSRAFVLAMTGDTAGAEKIAQTMMSPGLGAGLAPFFRRLPQLSAADRAFAVNFGELAETPARLADARLVPALPVLGPDPYAPKPAVAALPAPVVVANAGTTKRDKRRKRNEASVAVTYAPMPTPAPAPVAMTPPAYAAPAGVAVAAVRPTPVPAPVRSATVPVTTPPSSSLAPVATAPARTSPVPAPVATPPVRVASAASNPPAAIVQPLPSPTPSPSVATPVPTTPARVAAAEPTAPVVVTTAPVAAPTPPQPGVADQPSAAEAGVPATGTVARVSEDSVLARIVANTVAAPSYTPAPAPRPAPKPSVEVARPEPNPVQPVRTEPKPVVAKTPTKSTRARPDKDEVAATDTPVTTKGRRGRDLAAALPDDNGVPTRDARGRPIKVAAVDDTPALDKNGCPLPPAPTKGKRGAASTARAKVPLSAKCRKLVAAAAEQARAEAEAKSAPARVWVQVAGGANEASLEKAWQIMRDRAPALLRGRQGWTTPLRATNRVLTGPFSDEDEAQAFVNKLTKSGVPAFVFTSTRGQKIEKLSGK